MLPGAALLIGQYYRRKEFYIRFSYFICFALLGSAFSGVCHVSPHVSQSNIN